MKSSNKAIKWIKNPENWIPWTVFGGILVAVILSWMTIFFVEYGPYFDRGYQENLFDCLAWNEKGERNDYISIEINNDFYWEISMTVDFDGDSSYGSRVISNDSKGNGVAYKIEKDAAVMDCYKVIDSELKEKTSGTLLSSTEFASFCIDLQLPSSEMSFKPKMDNISVFKKDNALVSEAAMPQNKTYSLRCAGWEKAMELSNVKVSCFSYPWKSEAGSYMQSFLVKGYSQGSLINVHWTAAWAA